MKEEVRKVREYIESLSNKLKNSESLFNLRNMNAEFETLTRPRHYNLLSKDLERIDQAINTLKSKTFSELHQLQDLDFTVSSISSSC
jgi:predicted  nucleic acid-binding Zn-ribbon protein